MTRAVVQFHRFARFDPAAPKLGPEAYTARVPQVVARAPWEDALPPDDRVVVPGYTALLAGSELPRPAPAPGDPVRIRDGQTRTVTAIQQLDP